MKETHTGKKQANTSKISRGKKWRRRPLRSIKVALVYDRVNKWGGAERVLLQLHKMFPKAPLYTSVYHPKKAPWADVFDVRTSFLQKIPLANTMHEKLAIFMPLAFSRFNFDDYDVLISVTSEAAKNVRTKSSTVHVSYMLTPTRYLWSGYDEYFRNPLFRALTKPLVHKLRKMDVSASKKPIHVIAISKEVQKRIKKYYGRSSAVIYPPLSLNAEFKHRSSKQKTKQKGGYFLIVSRLVRYKRIDIAIEACNKLKLPLKIVGSGSQERYLRKIAGKTVEFAGNLTDEELVAYYKNCTALIFPGVEDLGLTVLEAQRLGKPVIAYGEGGALETVIDKKTGIFFSPQTANALASALKRFDKMRYNAKDAVRNAQRFSAKRFEKEFSGFLAKALQEL